MAKTMISNPDLVVAPDALDQEVQFNSGITSDMSNSGSQRVMIEVTVGSVRFGSGKPAAAASRAYGVGDKLVLPIANGKHNLWYKATTVNDSFSVSAI